ncbi:MULTISPECIES: fumarylacetoacetate hydrolase family protein [unclassified Rhodococcus (in: high G+C Gram-positive bacteria)]|nr:MULTISPECIES: fumarylacetoacetate hydrolase family protein [unclassified Rhodococcus (in: high G+C Gram-positive bacteria)]
MSAVMLHVWTEDYMQIIRFLPPEGGNPSVGIVCDEGIRTLLHVSSVAKLLRMRSDDIRRACEHSTESSLKLKEVQLLPPVDEMTEVWAAGVTYRRSQEARMTESVSAASVYDRIYGAPRPELFFKSAAWRVVGHLEPISVRADSEINVPEPELAVVINRYQEIVGFTICNDVSSRTIEGENPLYLPQAKMYLGGCAVGPGITPAWTIEDPHRLSIEATVIRNGETVWSGTASTEELHRTVTDLVDWLHRAEAFPHGVVLSTGTCLVPDLPFSIGSGDQVEISIEGLGTLANPVVSGIGPMRWLTESFTDPTQRLSRTNGVLR